MAPADFEQASKAVAQGAGQGNRIFPDEFLVFGVCGGARLTRIC